MKQRIVFLIALFVLGNISMAFSQLKSETEERNLQKYETPNFKITSKIAAYVGYDNNALLSGDRNGDIFEEVLCSLDFIKPLKDNVNL